MTWAAPFVLVTIIAASALALAAHASLLVGCAVWAMVVVAWWANRAAVNCAWSHRTRGMSVLELAPFVFGLQAALDSCVPGLGSALVLFGNLAAIASIVRGSWFPSARVVR